MLKIIESLKIKNTQYHWYPKILHISKCNVLDQLKYKSKHSLKSKLVRKKIPVKNQYISKYLAEIKSMWTVVLLIHILHVVNKKNSITIQIQTNIEKHVRIINVSQINNIK